MITPPPMAGDYERQMSGGPDSGLVRADEFESMVLSKELQFMADSEARKRVNARAYENGIPLDVATLSTYRELTEEPERIPGLVPAGGFVNVIAPAKTGKTTFMLNLAYSLQTGTPFLGTYTVEKEPGRIGWLNYEMTKPNLYKWADRIGLDANNVQVAHLRGRNKWIDSANGRADLAGKLNGVTALFIDSFAQAFTGKNENDNGEVNAYYNTLRAWAWDELGVNEIYHIVHGGKNGKGARGASAHHDVADVLIELHIAERQRLDEQDERRFISTTSRNDNDLGLHALELHPVTYRLTLGVPGGPGAASRAKRRDELKERIFEYVARNPGDSKSGVAKGVNAQNKSVSDTLDALQAEGRIMYVHEGRAIRCYEVKDERPTFDVAGQPKAT